MGGTEISYIALMHTLPYDCHPNRVANLLQLINMLTDCDHAKAIVYSRTLSWWC